MDGIELVRSVHGVEVPGPGRWPIAPGQHLALTVGRHPRRRHRDAVVTSGALVVGAEGLAITLELGLAGLDPEHPTDTWYVGRLACAELDGRWWFEGTLSDAAGDADSVRPAGVNVRYHGVYRHGGRALAWLGLEARLPLPCPARSCHPPARRFGARARWAWVEGDLNAEAPRVVGGGRAG